MRTTRIFVLIVVMFVGVGAWAESSSSSSSEVILENNVVANANVGTLAGGVMDNSSNADGGEAVAIVNGVSGGASDSYSGGSASGVSINTTSNYKNQTPPLNVASPYLPFWNHGGWGPIRALFPNGPAGNVYEKVWDSDNKEHLRELYGVLTSVQHEGPIEFIGGLFGGIGDIFIRSNESTYKGKGFVISNSLIKKRRRKGQVLVVLTPSSIEEEKLIIESGCYVHAGNVGVEGNETHNWDQAYNVAIAIAMLRDVDILLVSGGMKGVTIGSNTSFGSAGGYSQTNYSISLMGARAEGKTEGVGEPLIRCIGYRYDIEEASKRKISASDLAPGILDKIKKSRSSSALPQQSIPSDNVLLPKNGMKKAIESQSPPLSEKDEGVAEVEAVVSSASGG